MSAWRESVEVRPIDVADRDGTVGRVGLADFVAGTYPACEFHGALLCMTPRSERAQVWRCDGCGAGAEWSRPQPSCHECRDSFWVGDQQCENCNGPADRLRAIFGEVSA